jgi:two-component system LytT family response regulator
LRALIVDDEPLARTSIRLLLEEDGEVTVAGECSGGDAAALIARTRPDILFLDVQMPDVDGFTLLEQIGTEAVPAVVFVTAYDRYALRAFDVHAVDYLLKPFDDERFARALARAKALARDHRRGEANEQLAALLRDRAAAAQRFLVRVRDRSVVVRAEEIDWIEAADYYVTLHASGKAYLLREPIAELARTLDPNRFVRVHRSAIVNIDRVCEVHPLFRGDRTLVLTDGTRVRLSRARREAFERLFAGSGAVTRRPPD